nr:MAG TPA: hypothetical protein [Caudoviricetes sp.]
MHKVAMEMGKWAMEKAKTCGFDNLTPQDWDDLKDCMEAVKYAICADKDYRIVEAMDECEQEEKYLGRMGYDHYRYSNGRFAPKGRGSRMGYKPYLYMEDDDWMDEYLNNPSAYRMGYHPDRSDMRMDGMNRQQSRYGETYDRYSENRRHYHDSKDADSKQKMDSSMKEYTQDVIRTMSEMWSDADATLRQQMKTDLTKLLQQMN